MKVSVVALALLTLSANVCAQQAYSGKYPTGLRHADLERRCHGNLRLESAVFYVIGLTGKETIIGNAMALLSQLTGLSYGELMIERQMREDQAQAMERMIVSHSNTEVDVLYNQQMVAEEKKILSRVRQNSTWVDRLLGRQPSTGPHGSLRSQ
jgi:hypothetical protein